MWGGQSNTAQGRTVFPQGSHNTHKGIFSRGVPLDLWSGLRFAWEAVVSCVAEEHCAGAGPSLLWGGRKGEQFFFFYMFLN